MNPASGIHPIRQNINIANAFWPPPASDIFLSHTAIYANIFKIPLTIAASNPM